MTSEQREPYRSFHVGDILTVMDGRLVAPRGIEAVYDLCGYMTGEPGMMTHQLPRACRESEPTLRVQFPGLASVEWPDEWPEGDIRTVIDEWLSPLVEQFGEALPVIPLPPEDHTRIDPIEELRLMRPDAEIVVVVPGDSAGSVES